MPYRVIKENFYGFILWMCALTVIGPCVNGESSRCTMPTVGRRVNNKCNEWKYTEPSSTQSEVVENGVDRSTSEDSPDPSHNKATGSESDPKEQQAEEEEEEEESAEAQETEETNDPVSSSSNNSSDEGVSSAETPSASPSSSTELPAEGSVTAEITSDSSETADDNMEQD